MHHSDDVKHGGSRVVTVVNVKEPEQEHMHDFTCTGALPNKIERQSRVKSITTSLGQKQKVDKNVVIDLEYGTATETNDGNKCNNFDIEMTYKEENNFSIEADQSLKDCDVGSKDENERAKGDTVVIDLEYATTTETYDANKCNKLEIEMTHTIKKTLPKGMVRV